MNRIIRCEVRNEFITGAGQVIGAAGSHDDVELELSFSPVWTGTAKKIVWFDALGENPTVTALGTDLLVPGESEVYRVKVPLNAKAVEGDMLLTIRGVNTKKDVETRAVVAATARFRVLPAIWDPLAVEQTDVPASQADQLRQEIEKIKDDIVDAAKAADALEDTLEAAAEAAGSAQAAAGSAIEAGNSAKDAAQSAADAAQSARESAQSATESAQAAANAVAHKQDKLSGSAGQLVGFNAKGEAQAVDPAGVAVTSFKGRKGPVVPAAGDYTPEMTGAAPKKHGHTPDEVGAVPTSGMDLTDTLGFRQAGSSGFLSVYADGGEEGYRETTVGAGYIGTKRVSGLDSPGDEDDAVNKAYVDALFSLVATESVPIAVPRGRMRGDVNGDGLITEADADAIKQFSAGLIQLDETALWCAKVSGGEYITASDAAAISRYVAGTGDFAQEDYFHNWVYDSSAKVWSAEVNVTGLTTEMDATVYLAGEWPEGTFSGAALLNGKLRLSSLHPPVKPAQGAVTFVPGSGKVSLSVGGSGGSIVPVGVTSFNGRTGDVRPQAGDYTPVMVGAAPAGHSHSDYAPVGHTHSEYAAVGHGHTASQVGAVPTGRKVNNKALSADISLSAADVGAAEAGHSHTASQVGAVPTTRKVNNKALSADITLSAGDVGAVPTTRKVNGKALSADITLSAADVGAAETGHSHSTYVPTTRKVNGKALSGDITLSAGDVGAAEAGHTHTASQVGAVPTARKVNGKALNADITLSAGDVGAVPTTRKVNGKALSGDITLSASDVGAVTKEYVDELFSISIESVPITIPRGRMRGDVNGDGLVTDADATAIQQANAGLVQLDEVSVWCAKVTGGEYLSASDAAMISRYVAGTDDFTHEDYYGNWTYDSAAKTWHMEAVVPGLTTGMDASVRVSGEWPEGTFSSAEVLAGKLRFTSLHPPVNPAAAAVTFAPGSGNVSIYEGTSGGAAAVGAVSFNGRTGDVLPQAGDYSPTMVDAVPKTRTVNNKPLSADITLSASDVGAAESGHSHTASQVGAVPTARKVNGKALSADITLSASDVGAATMEQVSAAISQAITGAIAASY